MLPTWDKYWPGRWEQHVAARCSVVTGNHTAAEVHPPPAIHPGAVEVSVSLMQLRTKHSRSSVFKQQPGSTEVHFHTLLLRAPAGCPSGSRHCTLWAHRWCRSPTHPASARPWWPEGSISKKQWERKKPAAPVSKLRRKRRRVGTFSWLSRWCTSWQNLMTKCSWEWGTRRLACFSRLHTSWEKGNTVS